MGEVRDAAGRLTKITSADGTTVYFRRTLDGMGQIKEDRWFGGTVIKSNYYDAAGQLTNWVVKGSAWVSGRRGALTYDAGGRIVTQRLSYANGGLMTTNVYTYDLTDQLLSSSGTATYAASYDAVGNRTNADRRVYTVNNLNEYTALTSPAQSLSYDANGNLTNWNGKTFLHDSQGQMTSCSASSYAAKLCDYRRLRWFDGSPPYSGVAYTYDARGSLLDRHDTPGNAEQSYAYADGIDEAVLMNSTGGSYGNGLFAIVRDHLDSVVAILDSSGRLVETYDYSPFGKTTIRNSYGQAISTSRVGNTLAFTAREYDVNAGLYYYRNRWYSPSLGRFVQPDPKGVSAGDFNLYRYVRNTPAGEVDPFGLENTLGGGDMLTYGIGFFRGVGAESGYEVVRLDDCTCQRYLYFGLGAGIGGGFTAGQLGRVYNVFNPKDYSGFFATFGGALGPLAAGVSASPDYSVLPIIGRFFASNDSIPASAAAGLQRGLLKTSDLGLAGSIRYYVRVGSPYRCDSLASRSE